MIFKEEKIILKDGNLCILRTPAPEDAAVLLEHLKITSGETGFMIRYPEEITITLEEEQNMIKEQQNKNNCLSISGVINGRIIAHGGIVCVGEHTRLLHRANFGISIRKEFWGMGIGSEILKRLINGARDMGFEQIELGVIEGNKRGMELYKKYGFQVYGTRKNSFKYKDGSYAAEHLMVLEL